MPTAPKDSPPLEGSLIAGKYRVTREIGRGGMAFVYEGLHHDIQKRVAIKILSAEFITSQVVVERFLREARAAAAVRSPYICDVYDSGKLEDGRPFLVMELLEGESLAARGSRGTIPAQELLGYVDQLLDVLVKAHAEGIVHRDIKPDNLFVSADGRLKVLDFGIARVRDGSFGKQMATRAGIALGTVAYMPPEQLSGLGVDHRADLFATGATLLRLLTGRRIHESSNHSELLVRMATVPAPKVSSVCPDVDPNIAAVIDRSLAYDKLDRYADAGTMQADVRSLLRGEPPRFTGPPPRPAGSPVSLPTMVERSPLPPTVVGTEAAVTSVPTMGAPPAPPAPQGIQEPTNVYGPPSSDGPSSLAPVVVGSAFPQPPTVAAPPSYTGSVSGVVSTLPLPTPAVRPPDPAAILPTMLAARPGSVPPPTTPGSGDEPAKSAHGVIAMVVVGLGSLAVFLVLFLILGYVVFGRAPSAVPAPTPDNGDPVGLGGDKKPPIATAPPSPPPKTEPGDKDKDKKKKK